MRRFSLVALFASALLLAAGSASAQKIGVFDPNKLLTNSKLGQTLQEELNAFRVGKEAEIKRQGEDLEKRVEQYKAGVNTMSAEKREEVEADLGNRRRDLERAARDAEAELTRRRQKALRDLESEVAAILEDYGKRNGYTLIVLREVAAYSDAAIDISNDLVRLLDAKRPK